MKVLVMSDTHGYLTNAMKAIEKNPDVEMIIHLGDYCRDVADLEQLYPDKKFEYVYGNSDFGVGTVEVEKTLEIEGRRVFLTHGHKYSVKWDLERIIAKAESENAHIALYGHTHIALIEQVSECMLLNPGSISESRSNLSESYAILDITPEKVDAEFFYI
ncbi:metallophosphoesterase [Ruminiclostridium josui]|uniref:metallophosphoesterase n=1 Tax=Ruminiclostridium josui TaxID=1499 RepID=UPI0004658E65|nr:metallophosphoesterase [Ruminiclostridium josui]